MKKIIVISCIAIVCLSQITTAQSKKKKKRQQETSTVIRYAESYKGTPYRYGGTNKNGIDCSALIQNSFAQAGYKIPRTSKEQSKYGKSVGLSNVRPGDIVFFKFKKKRDKWYHSGLITKIDGDHIYFIHSSSSKGVVRSELTSKYYEPKIKSIRRVIK